MRFSVCGAVLLRTVKAFDGVGSFGPADCIESFAVRGTHIGRTATSSVAKVFANSSKKRPASFAS